MEGPPAAKRAKFSESMAPAGLKQASETKGRPKTALAPHRSAVGKGVRDAYQLRRLEEKRQIKSAAYQLRRMEEVARVASLHRAGGLVSDAEQAFVATSDSGAPPPDAAALGPYVFWSSIPVHDTEAEASWVTPYAGGLVRRGRQGEHDLA